MGEERERAVCSERIDVSVDFLGVEEDTRKRSGEVEWGVCLIVRAPDKSVGKSGSRECRGEEGFVVDVGRVLFFCSHRDEFGMCSVLAI